MIKKIIFLFLPLLVFTIIPFTSFAKSESLDFLRSTGKIYVVVAVVVAIFVGIVLYLVWLDRRLTKIENQIK